MTKKQKKMLKRIIIASVLMIVLAFLPVTGFLKFALYMVPYLVIGHDILRKAFLGVKNKQVFDEKTGENTKVELFSNYSLLQMVFFMRDYWYLLNGIELPTDNETWNKIREETILVSGNIQAKTES